MLWILIFSYYSFNSLTELAPTFMQIYTFINTNQENGTEPDICFVRKRFPGKFLSRSCSLCFDILHIFSVISFCEILNNS